MIDCKGRIINYLRISVTDRCNLRCTYCMPEDGIKLTDHSNILSFSQIVDFTKEAVAMGIDKIRITGGEPLVRKGITQLISMLSSIDGIKDLSMTTNGTLLPEFAYDLKKAGLMRVNISLDATDPVRYREITREGDINMVFKGVEAAKKAGLTPVKINCVIENSIDEPDAADVARYASEIGCQVRFIPRMDLEKGQFGIVSGGSGGDCAKCNRLRLTSTGMLKPCLFSNIEFDTMKLGARKAIEMALNRKPEKGGHNYTGHFYNIGG